MSLFIYLSSWIIVLLYLNPSLESSPIFQPQTALFCLPVVCRGDGGLPEWAASHLGQFAVPARALSVHPQASERLCGGFPATAPGGGQRHRQSSHLLHGYEHQHNTGVKKVFNATFCIALLAAHYAETSTCVSAFASHDNQTTTSLIMVRGEGSLKWKPISRLPLHRWSTGCLLHRHRHPPAGWLQARHQWHHTPGAAPQERWAPAEGRALPAPCQLRCLNISRLAPSEVLPNEEAERLNDVKFLVQQLYTTLRIEEHQLGKERELILRLEDLNSQLRPLEKVRYQFLPRDPRTGETKPPN